MAHIAGQRSGNSVVPYSQTTQRTKEVALTATASNFVPIKATGVAYADSDGNWRLVFNIKGSVSVGTIVKLYISIAGVKFDATTINYQSCSAMVVGAAPYTAVGQARYNSDIVELYFASAATPVVLVSGDVLLDEIPDWAAANMEASTDASIYIEPASSTQAGLQSKTIVARSHTTSVQAFGAAASAITFDTESYDTQNAVTLAGAFSAGTLDGSTGTKFTAPEAGYYRVYAYVLCDRSSGPWSTNDWVTTSVYKNGAAYDTNRTYVWEATTSQLECICDATVPLNATDFIQIVMDGDEVTTRTVSSTYASFEVQKIGNL